MPDAGFGFVEGYRRLTAVNPTALFGVPVPEREWVVQGWLPSPAVTLLYGDGGVGKTLLSQQLMTSAAVQKPWCGLRVEPVRSFALFCEDDEAELHRRQDAINRHFDLSFADLEPMRWASGVGCDNALIRFDQNGKPHHTERLEDLKKQAKDHGARLVVIDPAADTFGGNENDRAQVRQFIGGVLSDLALEIQGAVLLCAHPSKTGLASGNLDGGSTGWNNSARSRITLGRPKSEDGETDDTDQRILSKKKANYSSIGDEIKLRWQNGVIVPEGGYTGSLDRLSKAERAKEVFLALLDRCDGAGQKLHPTSSVGNYAPKIMASRPDAQGFNKRELGTAMQALIAEGRVRVADEGRPHKPSYRIARADPADPLP